MDPIDDKLKDVTFGANLPGYEVSNARDGAPGLILLQECALNALAGVWFIA